MAGKESDRSELRLLLVEHDPFARDVAMIALERLDVGGVSVAESGAEALGILESKGRFDLVVSAWDLPGFDGLELLKSVRNHWPGTGVVMITSNDQEEQISSALDAGVDAYLVKPVAVDALREAIGESLRKGSSRSDAAGDSGASPADDAVSELEELFAMLEGVLADAPADLPDAAGEGEEDFDLETRNRLNILMGKLAEQLANFVTSYDMATPDKLRVMQMHLDFMDAIRAGRTDLVSHESSNMIIDGLKMVIDLASD